MATVRDTQDIHDIRQKTDRILQEKAGKREDPLIREGIASFDRSKVFSECHNQLSSKILSEVKRVWVEAEVDVRLQDSIEVVGKTPFGHTVSIRRENNIYKGLNIGPDENVYYDDVVESLSDVIKVLQFGR